MAITLEQQLDCVQKAIAAIEGGAQAYQIGGKSLTRADLKTLYAREKDLVYQIARQNNGGIRIRRAVTIDD